MTDCPRDNKAYQHLSVVYLYIHQSVVFGGFMWWAHGYIKKVGCSIRAMARFFLFFYDEMILGHKITHIFGICLLFFFNDLKLSSYKTKTICHFVAVMMLQ